MLWLDDMLVQGRRLELRLKGGQGSGVCVFQPRSIDGACECLLRISGN